MHFIFHIKVVYNKLQFVGLIGGTLPGMKSLPPFQVIYQTAEDGLGDTVKPRLMEAEADRKSVV